MIETYVYNALTNASAITSLVSDRIFPVIPQENTELPFIVYTITQDDRIRALRGRTPTAQYTVTVDIYSITFDTGLAVADAVRTTLDGAYTGVRCSRLISGGSIPLD